MQALVLMSLHQQAYAASPVPIGLPCPTVSWLHQWLALHSESVWFASFPSAFSKNHYGLHCGGQLLFPYSDPIRLCQKLLCLLNGMPFLMGYWPSINIGHLPYK